MEIQQRISNGTRNLLRVVVGMLAFLVSSTSTSRGLGGAEGLNLNSEKKALDSPSGVGGNDAELSVTNATLSVAMIQEGDCGDSGDSGDGGDYCNGFESSCGDNYC